MNIEQIKIINKLVESGTYLVGCQYSGYGDSGTLENIFCINGKTEKEVAEEWLNFLSTGEIGNLTPWEHVESEHDLTSDEIQQLESLFLKHLNTVGDWWNNDGGQGFMVMEIPSCEFRNNNQTNYMETDYHDHKGSFKLSVD